MENKEIEAFRAELKKSVDEKINAFFKKEEPQELGIGWYVGNSGDYLCYRQRDHDNFGFNREKGKCLDIISCSLADQHHLPTPSENEEIFRLMTEEVKRRFMGKTVKCLISGSCKFEDFSNCDFSWQNDGVPDGSFWINNIEVWSAEKGFAEIVEEKEEPKDGEWWLSKKDGGEYLLKFKSKHNISHYWNYHIMINQDGLKLENNCCLNDNARKITPEEALPYFKKYFEKQGFKEGLKFKSAYNGEEFTINSELRINTHWEVCGRLIGGILFDNAKNTFATLVEDKLTIGGMEVKRMPNSHNIMIGKHIFDYMNIQGLMFAIMAGGEIKFNNEVLTLDKINKLRELANK